jgi:hypothetical protein
MDKIVIIKLGYFNKGRGSRSPQNFSAAIPELGILVDFFKENPQLENRSNLPKKCLFLTEDMAWSDSNFTT